MSTLSPSLTSNALPVRHGARYLWKPAKYARPERWAAGVYVVALILVFFQSNVEERMAARLLPLAALAVLLTWRRTEVLTRVMPLSLAGFMAWAAASYWWSADRSGSKIVLLDVFCAVIVAWCCGSFLTLESLHRLTTRVAKALSLLSVAFLVIAPGLSTRPAEDGAPGWHGPFSHKNGLGSFAVLALLCFWFDGGNRTRRNGWLALGVILLIGSQSSSALVLVLLSVAVVSWQRQASKHNRLWQRIGWLGALLSSVLAAVLIAITSFGVLTGLLGRGTTLSGRTNIWAVVIERIQEKPLEGWGFGECGVLRRWPARPCGPRCASTPTTPTAATSTCCCKWASSDSCCISDSSSGGCGGIGGRAPSH